MMLPPTRYRDVVLTILLRGNRQLRRAIFGRNASQLRVSEQ